MGRYVTGENFEYKFAFGDQSSSFGDVLDEIFSGLEETFVSRYIGEDGEIVRLTIDNIDEFEGALKNYLEDFKEASDEEYKKWSEGKLLLGNGYWDKFMIKKFQNIFKPSLGGTFEFFVEY